MKKLLIFLVIGLFLAVPFTANADIIGTVELEETAGSSTGNFYVVNVDEDILNVAESIVGSLNNIPAIPSSNSVLAVNPTIGKAEQFGDESSQNYLLRQVPEPTQMLLFGTGLIALAGIGRKRFFK